MDSSVWLESVLYAAYFHHMLDHGFYTPPSGFEVAFVSAAHTTEHIDSFLEALSVRSHLQFVAYPLPRFFG